MPSALSLAPHRGHVGVRHFAGNAELVLEVLPGGSPGEVAHAERRDSTHLASAGGGGSPASELPATPAAGGRGGIRRWRRLAVLADEDVAAVELRLGERGDGIGRIRCRGELHDATPLGSSIEHHDVGVQHLARLAEVVLQSLPRSLPRQVADVHAGVTARCRWRNHRPRGTRHGAAGQRRQTDAEGRRVVDTRAGRWQTADRLLAVLADKDVAAVELRLGERGDGVGRLGRRGERHDATPL
eukprot:scaffold161_cov89-Isochrysis_galbana.AAC.2